MKSSLPTNCVCFMSWKTRLIKAQRNTNIERYIVTPNFFSSVILTDYCSVKNTTSELIHFLNYKWYRTSPKQLLFQLAWAKRTQWLKKIVGCNAVFSKQKLRALENWRGCFFFYGLFSQHRYGFSYKRLLIKLTL